MFNLLALEAAVYKAVYKVTSNGAGDYDMRSHGHKMISVRMVSHHLNTAAR